MRFSIPVSVIIKRQHHFQWSESNDLYLYTVSFLCSIKWSSTANWKPNKLSRLQAESTAKNYSWRKICAHQLRYFLPHSRHGKWCSFPFLWIFSSRRIKILQFCKTLLLRAKIPAPVCSSASYWHRERNAGHLTITAYMEARLNFKRHNGMKLCAVLTKARQAKSTRPFALWKQLGWVYLQQKRQLFQR